MTNPQLTVFFDGGCPLCSKEIAHYRGFAGAERVTWLDVTDADLDLAPHNIDRLAALREFHVLDGDGVWHRGADGFLKLWEALAGYCWLARVCRWFRLPPLLRFGYRHFAAWHFRRRCPDAGCSIR